MGWFSRKETRAEVTGPVESNDPFLGQFLAARAVGADIDKASGHAVAIRCVATISEQLSMVPLKVYRKQADGSAIEAPEHPLSRVLMDEFAPGVSAFEGREALLTAVLVHGESFHRITRNGNSQPIGLSLLTAGSVTPERLVNGRKRYRVNRPNGGTEVLLDHEVLHVKYRSQDGLRGVSPITKAAAAFGLALSQTDQATAQAANAFRPAGALVFQNNIKDKDGVIQKFKDRLVGATKSGEVMILDGGAKFEQFSFSARDSEFLESRRLSNLDICRVYGVPPSVVGITDNSTYSNIGEESRALVNRCLAPNAARVEAEMNLSLLSPESRKTFFIAHDTDALLTADIQARYAAHKIGREGGWLSQNDIRKVEQMPSIPGGDVYLEPLNMARTGEGRKEEELQNAA